MHFRATIGGKMVETFTYSSANLQSNMKTILKGQLSPSLPLSLNQWCTQKMVECRTCHIYPLNQFCSKNLMRHFLSRVAVCLPWWLSQYILFPTVVSKSYRRRTIMHASHELLIYSDFMKAKAVTTTFA